MNYVTSRNQRFEKYQLRDFKWLRWYSFYISMQIMSESHGSNSQDLHTSVAGKLLFRKLIESKTFYIFTFSFEIQKIFLGSSNFSWCLIHEIFFHSTIARFDF